MTTADKIRELIEEKGLTQRQFAELVGIHYITLCNNLKNDNFSHKSIEKIADVPTIFLNEYSKSLYMKYKDRETEKGLLFPKKSNQKMNKCLKKIACKLGITREVSKTEYCGNDRNDITTKICDIIATHAGRRTFVVHCAEEGWTEEMIRTYTGHEDFKAMRPYFAIGDKKRRMFMESHF